jgi:hypothetical protein
VQSVFTQYGVLWFIWSDFVPRFCGSLALFVIVVAKPPSAPLGTYPRVQTSAGEHDEKVTRCLACPLHGIDSYCILLMA